MDYRETDTPEMRYFIERKPCTDCETKDAEIARLNAQIDHIADKLGKEHEAHVRDLVEKDAVIRAMANEYCLEHGVVPCAQTIGDLIDSFTREQEAHDAAQE